MNVGKLFLIVGPSGVGKDTLIDGAKAILGDQTDFAFPARFITRPQDAGGEVHIEISEADFAAGQTSGNFALSWHAHGLSYAIPTTIEAHLARGQSVVVNVSRSVLDQARQKFFQVCVISVSASSEVLLARLKGRGRETDAEISDRVTRASIYDVDGPDVVNLTNDGALADAIKSFVSILKDHSHANI